jgi:hypothetical protein
MDAQNELLGLMHVGCASVSLFGERDKARHPSPRPASFADSFAMQAAGDAAAEIGVLP